MKDEICGSLQVLICNVSLISRFFTRDYLATENEIPIFIFSMKSRYEMRRLHSACLDIVKNLFAFKYMKKISDIYSDYRTNYFCKKDIARYLEIYETSHPITKIVSNANRARGYLSSRTRKGSLADFFS